MNEIPSRADVTLANWRQWPNSAWAFQNVSELVPSAMINGSNRKETARLPLGELSGIAVSDENAKLRKLKDFLVQSRTDSLVVMRNGKFVAEWHAPACDPDKPHLLFSVSKSVTGILAGILADNGVLSANDPVLRHVREARGSAYGDATLRNLLDMEVALDFNEDYLDKTGGFEQYRRAMGWNPQNPSELSTDLQSFLCTIKKTGAEHGKVHHYRSPNTDLAGILLERAAGKRLPDLLSELLWKPLGAYSDAQVTVDRIGTSRAAGGMSATARDLARFGEMVRRGGKGVVSKAWIADLWNGGNRTAWANGDQKDLFPGGSYRSYWYESGKGELAAVGIHGQWIWIDPSTKTVIVKQSCQNEPTNIELDAAVIGMLRTLAKAV